LKPNDKAEIVQNIFNWFTLDRLTCGQIVKKLTSLGIPSPSGQPRWTRDTLGALLKNEVYIRKVRWKRRELKKEMDESGKIQKRRPVQKNYMLVEGKHPAIISEEQFALAQSLFGQTAPKKASTELVNPLAGLLCCSKCGRKMMYFRGGPSRYIRPRYTHRESLCKMKSGLADDVLSMLCQALREYIEDFSFKLDNADKQEMAKKHSAEMSHLEKELAKAQEKRRRLFDDYEDGNYTAEEFRERKTIWAERIERMTFELEELQHTKPEEIDYQEKIASFTKALEALQDPEISAKEKNILLKDIIETIEYTRGDDTYHTGEITLDIILKG
jgi:hypothetical protein